MDSKREICQTGRPLVFGEVLFDRFEKEGAVLGGAPFNVAWHLRGFGLNPLFISRIGEDELGNTVLEGMADWGMDTAGIQRDPTRPTGLVEVTIEEGEPHFEILPRQAYDFIETTQARDAVENEDLSLIYHGTLAARHPASRASLVNLVQQSGSPVFIDVNLRAPWWEENLVRSFLKGSRWIKMNENELTIIGGAGRHQDVEEAAAVELRRQEGLEMLIVTLGSQGAILLTEEKVFKGEVAPVKEVVDTVGAGDAFSAVCILGLTLGWGSSLILERALEFASRIVAQRGATRRDADMYDFFKERWKV